METRKCVSCQSEFNAIKTDHELCYDCCLQKRWFVDEDKKQLYLKRFDQAAAQGKLKQFEKTTGEKFNSEKLSYDLRTGNWDYINDNGDVIARFATIRMQGDNVGQVRFIIA